MIQWIKFNLLFILIFDDWNDKNDCFNFQDTEQELSVKVQELQLLQSESRTLGHEVEKLRVASKDLERVREEKESISRQFSDLSAEMKIFKEIVVGLEKEKSDLEFQLSEMREKGSRYFTTLNILLRFLFKLSI